MYQEEKEKDMVEEIKIEKTILEMKPEETITEIGTEEKETKEKNFYTDFKTQCSIWKHFHNS